jgi:hypothetical protein
MGKIRVAAKWLISRANYPNYPSYP